ncbi:hypothetical protein QUF80_04280, partial [Desulfococcaceae bacterium HSG8]|nr:hypothetical protein [Desulfococcaceae bacterium HSG8]
GVARGRVAARGGLANPLPAGVRICQSEPSGGRAARRRELLAAEWLLAGDWQIPRPQGFGFVNPNRAAAGLLAAGSCSRQSGCSRGIGKSPARRGSDLSIRTERRQGCSPQGVARGRVAARGGLANPLPAGVRICQSEPSGGRELLAAGWLLARDWQIPRPQGSDLPIRTERQGGQSLPI